MSGLLPSVGLFAAAFSFKEIETAVPVILSLIIIEGLLSVDNALAIAAMASHLPGRQKILALRYGILGAYVFRGLCLAFAAFIIANPWLKILGSAYLIYLACANLQGEAESDGENGSGREVKPRSFWPTVIAIEIMDLSLSVDNVVAAVALSPRLWVVCTGVFIGILALRFLAAYCITLIQRFQVLEKTAFLLVGYVGCLLLVEIGLDFDIGAFGKFIGIMFITFTTVAYSHSTGAQKILGPVLTGFQKTMRSFTKVCETLLLPLKWLFMIPKKLFVK